MDELTGAQLDLAWLRRHGLRRPLRVAQREGLGLAVPGPRFTVRDVAETVGLATPIDVIDVATQDELRGWTLGAWADYFHGARRGRRAVLNVISLEFSGTPLERHVRSPRVVRQIDWIDTVWPGSRRAAGQYPQVRMGGIDWRSTCVVREPAAHCRGAGTQRAS